MSKRNHQVQTPGETPVTAPEGDQADTQTQGTTQTTEAPQTDAKAAKKPAERPNYAQTPAADIDPDTLTAPVLSRDGWVIPTPKPATKA